MQIANTFASKALVAVVASAMIFSAFVAPAKAATAEELQAMINDLMAQMAALGGSTTPASSAAVCPYTWTRDLRSGSTGADVKKLQQFLNANADTRVAATGAGSTGMETENFGPATAAAVSKFQVMYRADILTPAGLSNPTGTFGPASRAKANALCVAGGSEEEEEEEESGDLSGEAALEDIEVNDADETDIEEGNEDAEIGEITVEFSDGDASISRIDLVLQGDGESNTTNVKPWDAFDEISLWVDGDEVARMSASDEDDFQDETEGVLRFSGLDIVAMEDEALDIVVAATVQENLDSAELTAWDLGVETIRFFDADGVATTEGTDASPVTSEEATFDIDVEGAGDDLDLKSSTNDIDETTLALDEDDSTEHDVFVFKLDADDSDGDVTLENITIDLALGSTTRNLNEVVNDVMIEVDGQTFSADDFDGTNDTEAVLFDIDGEVTIDAESEVEVTVTVEFEDMDEASALQGVTLQASVDMADIDAEGESGESITIGGADVNGDAHVLRSQGLVLEISSITETEAVKQVGSTDVDFGKYVFKFDVTAFGEDFYMDEDAAIVDFDLEVDGNIVASASSSAVLDISGADDAATADFMIAAGESATFTLTIETSAVTGNIVDGTAKVIVNSVAYSAADDATEELTVTATPVDDWTSGSLLLN